MGYTISIISDLSHNPMTKNLVLGTAQWGNGALGKTRSLRNDSTERNESQIQTSEKFNQSVNLTKGVKEIANTYQRPSCPLLFAVADA